MNVRWSWGSSNSNAVVLRVWQGRCEKIGDKRYVRVAHQDMYEDFEALGSRERLQHVEEIEAGKPAYLIMCRAGDPRAAPRSIVSSDAKRVFEGGEIVQHDGDKWVDLVRPLQVTSAKLKIQQA